MKMFDKYHTEDSTEIFNNKHDILNGNKVKYEDPLYSYMTFKSHVQTYPPRLLNFQCHIWI